jgi:hypothetical protein
LVKGTLKADSSSTTIGSGVVVLLQAISDKLKANIITRHKPLAISFLEGIRSSFFNVEQHI